jgi:integrase
MRKPKTRLTALGVARLKAPRTGRLEVFDAALPGFGLRVSATDARSYFVMAMAGAGSPVRDADGNIVAGRRLRRFTLGDARVVPLDEARDKARALLRRIDAGEDPAQPQAAVPTFRDFAFAYLARRKGNLRSSSFIELGRTLREVSNRWGDRPIDRIRPQDALAFIDDKAGRAPIRANRVLSVLRTLFADALRRGVIDASPVALLKPPSRPRSRDRALNDAEVAIFWTATDRLGWPFRGFYRLLLLTAQRRAQVQLLEWSHIDLEHRVWATPAAVMKSGREHVVHLSDLALDVLAEARGMGNGSGFVFSSDGVRPLRDFARAKARLDARMRQEACAPIASWHVHDLRRTVTHGLAAMGFAPHIADKILSHASGAISGTAAVYNKFEYLSERRDALNAWGNKVETIIGRDAGNVVTLAG